MKKLIAVLFLVFSSTTFADYGRFQLNDGRNILRIDIGNERETNSAELTRRVMRLERAVRELQNRVYDLEDDANPPRKEITVFVCSLATPFDGTFLGKGRSETEARVDAVNKCEANKKGSIFCGDDRIQKCESRLE